MIIEMDLNKKEVLFLAKLLFVEKDVYRLVWRRNLRRQKNLYLKFRGACRRAKKQHDVMCNRHGGRCGD